MDRKPITKVRVSAKRLREPDVLSPAEIASLDLRERAMVMLTESIWHQVVGVCKTEASAKPRSDGRVHGRRSSSLAAFESIPDGGRLGLASPRMKGKQPYWPDNLMKRYIRPVARKAGIDKNIGWHTFRHSFGTLLKANGGRREDRSGALEAR